MALVGFKILLEPYSSCVTIHSSTGAGWLSFKVTGLLLGKRECFFSHLRRHPASLSFPAASFGSFHGYDFMYVSHPFLAICEKGRQIKTNILHIIQEFDPCL